MFAYARSDLSGKVNYLHFTVALRSLIATVIMWRKDAKFFLSLKAYNYKMEKSWNERYILIIFKFMNGRIEINEESLQFHVIFWFLANNII